MTRTHRRCGKRLLLLAVLAAAVVSASAGPAAEPGAGTEIAHPVDGARMVYVPAGPFTMGLSESEADTVAKGLGFGKGDDLWVWAWEAYPKRTLTLSGYFIDKYEVTVAQWQRFVKATGDGAKSVETSRHFGAPDKQKLPTAEITWDEAKRYAKWAGKALPTEAQWEKAARGTDGRLYPWGNEPPTPERGHFGQRGHAGEDGKGALLYAPVGSYPQGVSPYGAMDMLGNQYEWTSERQVPYPGNPQAEKMRSYMGDNVCLRGGSWYHGWVSFYAAKRFGLEPDETYYHIGFRTVWVPPAGYFESQAFVRHRRAAQAHDTGN